MRRLQRIALLLALLHGRCEELLEAVLIVTAALIEHRAQRNDCDGARGSNGGGMLGSVRVLGVLLCLVLSRIVLEFICLCLRSTRRQ